MEENPAVTDALQWHPTFFTVLQIELEDDKENLIFENEHQLSKKPMGIDVLVIKKEKDNLVCSKYPYKLIRHLKSKRKYTIEQADSGIYYIWGDFFPIQIIVTSRLSEENNLWLKNLTNNLRNSDSAQRLLTEYGKHKDNKLYQTAMNMIIRANTQTFEEVKDVCEALMELMKDKIDAAKKDAFQEGIQEGIQINIRTYKNFNVSKEATITNVMKAFSLSKDEATGYVEKYW